MAKCDLASFCICNCLVLFQLNSESPVQMSKSFYIQFIFRVGRTLPCPIQWYRKIFLVGEEIYTMYNHYLLTTQVHWIAWNKTEITQAGTPDQYVEEIPVLSQKMQGKGREKRDERSRFCCFRKGQWRCSKEMLSRTRKVGNLKTKQNKKKPPLFTRDPQKRQHKTSTEVYSYLGDWSSICSLNVCKEQNAEQFLSKTQCLGHLASLQEFAVDSEFHK